ncbi:CLUMA_CG019172, isoform A [Clunio marinus]|uniref:CLUMA_CG019172, isoform A n=1 Tax=Clunio marinus TaxID=568069 RepID=A0A1J1J0I2_9DIPT|nr:CLUMA_CG019172, isoform A [Clunio marinus]
MKEHHFGNRRVDKCYMNIKNIYKEPNSHRRFILGNQQIIFSHGEKEENLMIKRILTHSHHDLKFREEDNFVLKMKTAMKTLSIAVKTIAKKFITLAHIKNSDELIDFQVQSPLNALDIEAKKTKEKE